MTLANRFVRSSTWEGLAGEDGSVTPALIEVSRRLTEGGIGLILSGHAYVSREGQATPWQLGAYADSLVPGLTDMARAVHELGGKIALQLAHAGSRGATALSGRPAMGPSAGEEVTGTEGAWEMSVQDIEDVSDAFALAAVRARRAGFDGVQVHAAHGYLLSQFLSPFFNKREDGYGGALENRSRFVVEVVRRIRNAVGDDFPVLIKINSEDFVPGGFTVDEMVRTAEKLVSAGVDAIEMSGGTFSSGKKIASRPGKAESGEPEAYYEAAARRYKEKIEAPLMLVGGIRGFETAERLVTDGTADYIALSRPLIREPGLISRWKSGDRRPALCVNDNGCFAPGFAGQGIQCTVERREAEKARG